MNSQILSNRQRIICCRTSHKLYIYVSVCVCVCVVAISYFIAEMLKWSRLQSTLPPLSTVNVQTEAAVDVRARDSFS